MIPRFKPWLDHNEILAIFRRNKGAVHRFEKSFANTFEAEEAIAFSYGRSALWTFFKAVGIEGSEVIMPAYTCSVVAHAVSLSGNSPRFVDIRLSDYNMDLDLLVEAINKNTKAIIATHLFGYPLDIDLLEEIVAKAEKRVGHKIWLIQDCAHSFGARWKGRLVCNSGDLAIYGLNISKMITSIFGGMITTTDQELAQKIREWRNANFKRASYIKGLLRRVYLLSIFIAFSKPIYSLTHWLQKKTPVLNKFTKSYHLDDQIHFPPDYLDQLSDIEGAVGIEQLKKYPDILSSRRKNAVWLINKICWPSDWELPQILDGATYSHFVVRVPDRRFEVEKFAEIGIQLGEIIQYCVPEFKSYKELNTGFKNSKYASETTINIPMYPGIKLEALNKIKNVICG